MRHSMQGSMSCYARHIAGRRGQAPAGVGVRWCTFNNFTYGLVTPVLGYVMSSLGCFLGLRCTTRARASHGAQRARWLLLAAVSVATTGIWVMHFVAMLGFTIPGQTITYSVPVTILSMLIAVVVVGIGLLIVGFGSSGWRTLLLGGLVIGLGVASMHYIGMAAMRMPDTVRYDNGPGRSLGGHRGGGRDGRAAGPRSGWPPCGPPSSRR